MNEIIRTITGMVVVILSLWLIVYFGFFNETGIDYVAIILGLFSLLIGIYIIFNKGEDDIEQIKK